MPPKKKSSKTKGKAKPKQKQRQQQSQKIIINLARDLVKQKRQRRAKPRADTQGASSRVLGQFAPLPQYTPPPLINNASSPRPFQQAISTPAVANAFANRAPPVVRQSLAGETPLPTTSIAPPSTLGRQSSVPKLQRAVSELKELTEKVKALPDPLTDEAAEFQRNLTAQREFEAGGGGGAAAEEPAPKKKLGRPKGSRNKKQLVVQGVLVQGQEGPQYSDASDVTPAMALTEKMMGTTTGMPMELPLAEVEPRFV